MTSVSAATSITTDVALRILGGEKPATITTPVLQYGPAKYDWRQLQRWGTSESRLPPGSEIQFREATTWEKFRREIVLGAAILLIQAVLISWLLLEHRRRHEAELQAKKQMSEIAHVTRFSMAGELQVLAHRLNRISEQHRRSRDFTLNALRYALRELLACFPVYRTYPGPDGVSEAVLGATNRVVRLQTGYVYHYAFAMMLGVAAFITWYLVGGIH